MKTKPKTSTSSMKTTTTEPSPPTQFLREEHFARVKPATKDWSARDAIREALRIGKHFKHVDRPSPPIIHYGLDKGQLLSWLKKLQKKSRSIKVHTSRGPRRQRSDTPILLSIVASHPAPPSQRSDPAYLAWRNRTIAWFRRRYGDEHIVCILEHVDEGHLHLHVLVHNFGASVKPFRAGEIAVAKAIAKGVPKSEHGKEYRSGITAMLDDYWQDVGAPCGLSRRSAAPRPRAPNKKYLKAKEHELEVKQSEAARAQAEAEHQAAQLISQISAVRRTGELLAPASLLAREQALANRERENGERDRLLVQKQQDLERRDRELAEKEAQAQALTVAAEKQFAAMNHLYKLMTPDERDELTQRVARLKRN
jgi:hypothetical protein